MSKDNRYRNFVSIGYPESLIEGWVEILEQTHIPMLISPLHDRDINPSGELKKAHYHIVLMYENKHTQEDAQAIFDLVGAIDCRVVKSLPGQARYLCHLDNPEKEQYRIEDVKELSGADYRALIERSSDRRMALKELVQFIEDNDVLAFNQLVNWCSENDDVWFSLCTETSTVFLTKYLQSRHWTIEKDVKDRSAEWIKREKPKKKEVSRDE